MAEISENVNQVNRASEVLLKGFYKDGKAGTIKVAMGTINECQKARRCSLAGRGGTFCKCNTRFVNDEVARHGYFECHGLFERISQSSEGKEINSKTEVKKFTLDSFQRFCWNSDLVGEEDFSSIASKFFDCAAVEWFNDELILTDDEGRHHWARTEEIDSFLDHVSSQYLGLCQVKLEEKPMDHVEFAEECCSIVLQVSGYIKAQDDDGVLNDYDDELLVKFVRKQILRVKPYLDYLYSKRNLRDKLPF